MICMIMSFIEHNPLPPASPTWYPADMPRARSRPSPPSRGFVLGRERFARISAVEGIALTDEMRATLERFDREGLSADERRRAILARFSTKR